MKITFLGTSSGVPTKQRNVTGIALSPDNTRRWYLVDCGEATQHQLLHTPLSLLQLKAIMITHIHGDHCYGLPGLLASAATHGRTEALTIVGPSPIKNYIDAVCHHTALTLPYPLEFRPVETMSEPLATPDYRIGRIPVSHRVPSFTYELEEVRRSAKLNIPKLEAEGVPRGPVWGHLQSGKDITLDDSRHLTATDYLLPTKVRRVIIGGDNDTPDLLQESAVNADLLIHEATYTAEVAQQVGPGPQHSSARSVAQFAERVRLPNLILTHFSQRYHRPDGAGMDALHEEARRYYRGNLFLARDLEVYQLDANGLVTICDSG